MFKRAIAFAAYGLAAMGLAYLVLPLQRLEGRLRGRSGEADVRAQRTIHITTRGVLRLWDWLGAVRARFRGAEALARRPLLVVANHPSLVDTPLVTACMPQADFIVSPEWTRNPFLHHAIKAAGYLRAERGAAVVREAVARLRAGRSVVVYPEGSRTPPEGLREFQRGAAHIALRANCDLVPVVIRVSPRTLMKGQRFTDIPDAPEWQVEVGEPIHPGDYLRKGEGRSAAARRLTAALTEYFEKRWDSGSC